MNLLVFQEDKAYIKQCLENGEIDYLEAASDTSQNRADDAALSWI